MSGSLEGKIALVTGGAQGIGRAIADGLGREGATVVIADLNPPEGGIRADVSSEADVDAMVRETVDRHGGVDILVNNAGLYASLAMRPFTEIPPDEWRQVMDVNVASMFLTCRAVVPVMRERGGGKIVNISSGTPFRGVPFLLHYVTSKGAIVAFTRALAKELGKDCDLRQLRRARFHHVRRGHGQSGGGGEAARRVRLGTDAAARPGARGRRRGGGVPVRPRRRLRHRPDDGDRRRAVLPLRVTLCPDGVETQAGPRVVYDLERDEAHVGAARVDGSAIVWEIDERPDGDWLIRCDRVDFPPGGVAYRHTHPGPGIRFLLKGRIRIDSGGESHEYGPLEWWYESGPEPVFAEASPDEETAFVRVMLVPGELEGQRTIRYVDPADEEKPKLQRARIYLEQPL